MSIWKETRPRTLKFREQTLIDISFATSELGRLLYRHHHPKSGLRVTKEMLGNSLIYLQSRIERLTKSDTMDGLASAILTSELVEGAKRVIETQ